MKKILKENWQYLLFFLINYILYNGISEYDFVNFDDHLQVYDNISIQNLSFQNLKAIFSSPTVGMYQPITSLLFSIVYWLFELDAGYYHLLGSIIHFINACLVFKLLNKLFKSRNDALILSLLFLIHPLMVESVLWISATSTLFYSFFFLTTIICYTEYLENQKSRYYYFAILLFLLGIMTKIQMVTFVPIALLLLWLYDKISIKSIVKTLPFIILSLIFVIIAFKFRENKDTAFEYSAYFMVPTQIMWYPFKYFAPFSLSALYDWPLSLGLKEIALGISIIIIPILLYIYRKNKIFVFGILFYLTTIILHTSLFSRFLAPYADRYVYIPSIGILICLFAIGKYFKNKIVVSVSIIAFILFSIITFSQKKVWSNSETLWTNNMEYQETPISYVNRASHYIDLAFYDKAIPDIKYIIQSKRTEKKDLARAYYFSGIINFERKNYSSSEKDYLKVIEIDKNHFRSYYNLGNLYSYQNRFLEAVDTYSKGIKLENSSKYFHSIYKNRANAYNQLKQYEKALIDVNKAIEINKSGSLKQFESSLLDFKNHLQKEISQK